jgi:hypothetical protein
MRGEVKRLAIEAKQHPKFGLANSCGILEQGLENRLQVARRSRDYLEHIGGGGLLLERFAQLAEQAGVLDRDDRLRGEVRDQLNLLVGERANLLAVNTDPADQLIFLEHRYAEYGPRAAVSGDSRRGEPRRNIGVILFGVNVGNVHRMFRQRDSCENGCRRRTDNSSATALLRQPRRHTVQCGDSESSFPLP